MGKKELTRIALAITLSMTVMAVAVSSNKPTASDVETSIESIQVKSVGSILQENHNERIRIAKEKAIRVEKARIAEEVRLAEEAKKAEEARIAEVARIAEIQRQEELKEQEAKVVAQAQTSTPSRGGDSVRQVTFELTFYTSLPNENGGYGLMANGEDVATATNAIATNYYKMGTKINLTGYGTYTVQDRGGSSFDSRTRLDVLITRKSGESDSQYKTRVMNMGRVKVVGYVQN